ncbi:chemotaxis protein CheA [Methylocella silvestris]|uniref:Chemotaxis protein CheA n=1 Tax=Methylocella silvestris TaxID=199596 RepID=A0A2J7TE71_METSI|nr:chemotaxis protein CheA [Methylocella silvestris]PNG25064.1 chemotaxis protein CheA [Methylocella silvestris]
MTDCLDPVEAFRQEAAELLDALETTLLDLGQRPQDRDLIDAAFRALHTIKGSGSMFGFDQVAAFTHDFETAFDLVRKGKAEPSDDLVTVALAAKDYIRALIESPESTDAVIGASVIDDLKRVIDTGCGVGAGAQTASRGDGEAKVQAAGLADPAAAGWRMGVAFEPDILRNGTDPLNLLDDLRRLGACVVTPSVDRLPEIDALDPEQLYIQWRVELVSDCGGEAIEDVFVFVRDSMDLTLAPLMQQPGETAQGLALDLPMDEQTGVAASTPVEAAQSLPGSEADPRREPARRVDDRASTTVRVPAARLDQLMDRVGELVIAQARLSQLAATGSDLAIKAVSEDIERLAAALRDTTMGARMVPMGSLFGRFRRLVHDLSRDLGKPVEFITSGEDTELDKTLIERLADPLVHLIRNAIDHGVEDAERRSAAGKPAQGTIELSASHVGAQMLIRVCDDGGGLDVARIRAKAEEQGLIAPGAPASEQEIYQFLFHPGFSTAKALSALSGRGVGMDVVKRMIESMRGSIDIATNFGKGTQITLRLPLTLAIIEGLLVRVGIERYVIPLAAVEECVELSGSGASGGGERSFLSIRGDLIPFLRLREMFRSESAPDLHQKVIIISTGEMRVGLVVDQIIGSHQTVIKSLSKLHSNVSIFSGATILGDGRAALILDVAQIISAGQAGIESLRSEAA